MLILPRMLEQGVEGRMAGKQLRDPTDRPEWPEGLKAEQKQGYGKTRWSKWWISADLACNENKALVF